MDPTAPENSDQNTQSTSPIQPGQFVVATEENVNGQPGLPPILPASQPPVPASPDPAIPAAPESGFTANPYAPSSVQTQGPPPPSSPIQPDPTPFSPIQPTDPQAAPPGGDSKFGKVKIIGIAAGVISLLVIILALVWFFVIRGKTNKPPATTQIIEESTPSASPATGFGQINESTPEASSQASPESSQPPQTVTVPAQ